MHSQIPVDSSTPNADKHANVPGGPSWPFGLAVSTELVIFLQQQVGQDRLVPIHVLHRLARHGQGAGGGRGRSAPRAPRSPCLGPGLRPRGPRSGAPPERDEPCPLAPPRGQGRLPPAPQSLSAAPPGGLRARRGPAEAAGPGTRPRRSEPLASGVRAAHLTPVLRFYRRASRLGFPGSSGQLCRHLHRLLPAALPLLLHPAQPAHAPRPPHRTGLFPRLRLQGANPGRGGGGA